MARSANPTRCKAIHDTRNPQPDTRVSLKFFPGGGEGIGSLRSGQSPVAVGNAHLRKVSALLRRPPPGVLIPSTQYANAGLSPSVGTKAFLKFFPGGGEGIGGATLGADAPILRIACSPMRAHRTQGFSSLQSNLAEGKGFEPPEPCGSSDFESDAIDHSATPPNQDC